MKLNKCCRNRLFYFTFILFCVGCVDCFCCNRSRFVLCWSATKAIPTVIWLISLLCVSSITVVSGMTCFSGTSNLNSKLKNNLCMHMRVYLTGREGPVADIWDTHWWERQAAHLFIFWWNPTSLPASQSAFSILLCLFNLVVFVKSVKCCLSVNIAEYYLDILNHRVSDNSQALMLIVSPGCPEIIMHTIYHFDVAVQMFKLLQLILKCVIFQFVIPVYNCFSRVFL